MVAHYRKLGTPTTNETFDAEFEKEINAWAETNVDASEKEDIGPEGLQREFTRDGFRAKADFFWGGDHESGVGIAELDLVDEIQSRTLVHVLAADSRKNRQEKIYGILGNNSSLGPAVREGGKQSDTPFVGRPRLFDLGCSVRPAYMIRVHSPEAVTAGPWPRSILQGLVQAPVFA